MIYDRNLLQNVLWISQIGLIISKMRQNHNDNDLQEQSQPKKRIKYDPAFVPKQQPSLFCQCLSKPQISLITSGIVGLQSYKKYVSVMIRHQEKSIQTLPKEILEMEEMRELGERVERCIACARYNNQLLDKIVGGYSQIAKEMGPQLQNIALQSQISPNAVINIFSYILKQWTNISSVTRKPMDKIIELANKYQNVHKNMEENGEKDDECRIFVQGFGMGRIVCQLYERLEKKPALIEGCQDRVLHYLCAEYFVSCYQSAAKHKIYPFIHDFTNRFKISEVYESVEVPEWPYPTPTSTSPPFSLSLTTLQQTYHAPTHTSSHALTISYLCNDRVTNLLKWIQIVYKNLKQGGLWIIACYGSFERNVIPVTYGEFRDILAKTQFGVLWEEKREEEIMWDRGMIGEIVSVHYLVLKK